MDVLHSFIHQRTIGAIMNRAAVASSVMSDSVRPHGQQPTRLFCPRDSLGKDTGVGCPVLLLNRAATHIQMQAFV